MQVGNLLHKWNVENDQACNNSPTSFQLVRLVGCGLTHNTRILQGSAVTDTRWGGTLTASTAVQSQIQQQKIHKTGLLYILQSQKLSKNIHKSHQVVLTLCRLPFWDPTWRKHLAIYPEFTTTVEYHLGKGRYLDKKRLDDKRWGSSKAATCIWNHVAYGAKFIRVIVRSKEDVQRRISNRHALGCRELGSTHVHAPRTVDHPQERVVCQVDKVQVSAVAWTSPGTVAGLEPVRSADPRPVKDAEVNHPLVQLTVSGRNRTLAFQAAALSALPRSSVGRSWSECSSGCAEVGNHVLVDDKDRQRVSDVHVSSSVDPQLQSETTRGRKMLSSTGRCQQLQKTTAVERLIF